MAKLTAEILDAWKRRNGPVVLTTVAADGTPNAIYATCVGAFGEDTLVVADNYFDKTRQNLLAGGKGSILFTTDDKKAFQVKGRMAYHQAGPVFDDMKRWNPAKHPGHGAAALQVEAVYSGAQKLL